MGLRDGRLMAVLFTLGIPAALVARATSSAGVPQDAPAPVSRSPHGEMAGDCATCHTPERWSPLRKPLAFDHRGTGFPLEAAHSQASCRDCHRSLIFSQVGTACADCHRDAHRGELGGRCESCHGPESWTNRQEFFRVHNRTRFPLLAAHARLDCEACHGGQQPQQFVGTSTECVSCHQADYDAAKDPNHRQLRLSRECTGCHSIASSSWEGGAFGSSFPHPETFPLQGAHGGLGCDSCHASGFSGTSRQCVTCHRGDYDRASNPNHRTAGFPEGCQACHGTSGWRPADFDHGRFFPLTRDHGGIPCATCHVNPGSFRAFQCLTCHGRERMDDKHDDVSGYRYESQACYSCHPRGEE